MVLELLVAVNVMSECVVLLPGASYEEGFRLFADSVVNDQHVNPRYLF